MGLGAKKSANFQEEELMGQRVRKSRASSRVVGLVLATIAAGLLTSSYWQPNILQLLALPSCIGGGSQGDGHPLRSVEEFQACSIKNMLDTGLPFLRSAKPLPAIEFIDRRDRLARALVEDGVDAYIAEPGYAFKYYANVSQSDWEPWEPEERPFLMIIEPYHDARSDSVISRTSLLAPSFEAERARLLPVPLSSPIEITTWEEHWNPYQTLRQSKRFERYKRKPKVMVDEEMRDFIQRGLSENGFQVMGLSGQAAHVRQRKSSREIDLLRAVNTGTVEAVRQMRKCMSRGFTEQDVKQVLDNTLKAAGLEPFFDIVLFDENASNPHGGTNGSKTLEDETLVLIDVGAHLHGYSSDICRTFFAPYVPEPDNSTSRMSLSDSMQEKLKVWDIVFEAQSKSLLAMKENRTAAGVDIAARTVIDNAGYEDTFTHRVGHGIGIKAHESPYLNKGNVNTTLLTGMTFTSEPGIYLVNKFGVRHEDVFLVDSDDEPQILSGSRAESPWQP